MRVNLQIAGVASETGPLLQQYLVERGLTIDRAAPATICYGLPTNKPQNLNGECGGGDKMQRLHQMADGGVRTVPWFAGEAIPPGFAFPALARKRSGHGGEDLVPVFQPQEVPWRVAAGWDWFSSYVPLQTEYRVWIFRDECLDVYEKVMRRPRDYTYIGRNFRNGFDFALRRPNQVPPDVVVQAKRTVRAVSFDFAAVDLLLGEDNDAYVLEANTAPGVIRSGAQNTLAKLADRMVSWAITDCPERGY